MQVHPSFSVFYTRSRAHCLLRRMVGMCTLGLLASGVRAQEMVDGPSTIWLVGPGATLPLTSQVGLQAYGFGVLGDLHGAATVVSLRVQLSRYVIVTPGYFGGFLPRRADGVQPRDNRARLAVTLTLPLPGLYISDRNLIERRFQEATVTTRYRNLLRLEDTVRLGPLHFTVYAADEFFYDGRLQRWTLNQAYLGLTYPFARRYTGEVLYGRQLSPRAPGTNLFQLAYSVRFNQLRFSSTRPAK